MRDVKMKYICPSCIYTAGNSIHSVQVQCILKQKAKYVICTATQTSCLPPSCTLICQLQGPKTGHFKFAARHEQETDAQKDLFRAAIFGERAFGKHRCFL